MSIKSALNTNTLRFSVLYALAMSVAGIDLSLTVRSGKDLTGHPLGGTAAYVMIGIGTILAARVGMRLLARAGLRNTFVALGGLCAVSGLITAFSVTARQPLLFYLAMLCVGVFMGLSYYHRLLVRDLSARASTWDTSLVLLSGIIGAVVGPLVTSKLSPDVDTFYHSYFVVAAIGVVSALVSLTLPRVFAPSPRTAKPETAQAPKNDKSSLYLGGIIGFGSYLSMTVIMAAVPLQAASSGINGSGISALTQMHMVAMYLPILAASAAIAHQTARPVAWWQALITIVALGITLVVAGDSSSYLPLAAFMIIAGINWAFGYSAASDLVAGSSYGRHHPSARGRAEIMPPIGMITGSLLGGILLGFDSFTGVVLTAVVGNLVIVAALVNDHFHRTRHR